MMQLTPAHTKAIKAYYEELATYKTERIVKETSIRSAFQSLLKVFAQQHCCLLVTESSLLNGNAPDGMVQDANGLPLGYWEAKDLQDDLEKEIHKKFEDRHYPQENILFENSQRAILYQQKQRAGEFDITNKEALIALLEQFFGYIPGNIEGFEQATQAFKENIPQLADSHKEYIRKEHAINREFATAFTHLHRMCRLSLNPAMTIEQVEEMLVQHLLTERLITTIFENPDFTKRNVIAHEVEKVIEALTVRQFNRATFFKGLDRFYVAIEDAAKGLTWSEKQHFLNVVYERFFQGYSTKQADVFGIVYTPQEIVSFMCKSIDDILQKDFEKSIGTPGVQILDPCTGTGNFVVHLLQMIPPQFLDQKYREDLFCNEIMLLPYYIASLNIEHAYYERTQVYQSFNGICFADTLGLSTDSTLPGFEEGNAERIEREKDAPIMVVVGNPPYNVGQKNENDNNKNRKYSVLDAAIQQTYSKRSVATNRNALSDAYVKFFRWATDRLHGKDGIVCFVSNNSFVQSIAFDGFRKSLAEEFTDIYHLDLGGNARHRGGSNVFNIMVGVGITILVRHRTMENERKPATIHYHAVSSEHSVKEKLLAVQQLAIGGVDLWQQLQPDVRGNWITEDLHAEFTGFLPMGTKEGKTATTDTIFKKYSSGVKTNRDDWVYNFQRSMLEENVQRFIETYNGEVDRWKRSITTAPEKDRKALPARVDDFVTYDDTKIKWSRDLKLDLIREKYVVFAESKVRQSMYRPFTKQYLFFDRVMNEEIYQQHLFFPTQESEQENTAICVSGVGSLRSFQCLATKYLPCLDMLEKTQCFPFYTYDETGQNRTENITDSALKFFQSQYHDASMTKWDIFHGIYGLLHHPVYREHYAENLRLELPRIPILASPEMWHACVLGGSKLMRLHTQYETLPEYKLTMHTNSDVPFSYAVHEMKLSGDHTSIRVNDSLTLAEIPPEVFEYRLGNRSALEWVIDQYKVSDDKRTSIHQDPNRLDDPEYIVRLVKQVVMVSVKTVSIVHELEQCVLLDEVAGEMHA
jgi:predicted helicase